MFLVLINIISSLLGPFSATADSFDAKMFESEVNEKVLKELSAYYSPRIEGRTLIIKGAISSHIYDFLSLEDKNIRGKIDTIELNSLGGSSEYALMIAEKVKSYKVKTRLSKGSFCASACVVIFSAGSQREMDEGTWFGVHASRLGAGFYTGFWGLCFVELENDEVQFTPGKKGCKEIIDRGIKAASEMTNLTFDFMEQNGVSHGLRKTYYAKPDDLAWPASGNVLKKPDWILNKAEALKWNLVLQ